jgi:hypothetical protein
VPAASPTFRQSKAGVHAETKAKHAASSRHFLKKSNMMVLAVFLQYTRLKPGMGRSKLKGKP